MTVHRTTMTTKRTLSGRHGVTRWSSCCPVSAMLWASAICGGSLTSVWGTVEVKMNGDESHLYFYSKSKHMVTSSNGNIYRVTGPLCGDSPVTGEFPSQRTVTRSFDVVFDRCLSERFETIASQITSLAIVYSAVYSDADERKHQSSASLAFVRGVHRGPVNFPHKWPITRKMFPFDDVIMRRVYHRMGRK